MPYSTLIEREAMEEGREEGVVQGQLKSIRKQMNHQFGEAGMQLMSKVEKIDDPSVMDAIQDKLLER